MHMLISHHLTPFLVASKELKFDHKRLVIRSQERTNYPLGQRILAAISPAYEYTIITMCVLQKFIFTGLVKNNTFQ